jgi:ER-derived vesicles protein
MNAPYSATTLHLSPISPSTRVSRIQQLKQYTSKFVDVLESCTSPVKPYIPQALRIWLISNDRYLPALGRFLIIATFLEDALRIVTQFKEQITYLTTYRILLPWGAAHLFLLINVCVRQVGIPQ